MLFAFGLTLFVSALLLFVVEPMVGKMILPLLGGTPAVWNTCMVFYQVTLLAGYAYAHFATRWLGPRRQALVHVALLLIPFFFFPLAVSRSFLEGGEEHPILPLLGMLVVCAGMPLFVVCTTAPLLQRWFASTRHRSARDPYFLYGASNLGSMLALLAYPTLIEPRLKLSQQTWDWSIGYAVLAALTVLCAWFLWQAAPQLAGASAKTAAGAAGHRPPVRPRPPRPQAVTDLPGWGPYEGGPNSLSGAVTWSRRFRWALLAAVPSSLMLGVTTYITTDLAAIPLLWVLPLALYLLTFIIVFARVPMFAQSAALAILTIAASLGMSVLVWQVADETGRPALRFLILCCAGAAGCAYWIWELRISDLWHRAMVLALPLLVLLVVFLVQARIRPRLEYNIALHLLTLFVACMVCHGELARDRPGPEHLTEFYLWMSIGGGAGGMFNALAAPLLFRTLVEYPLAMVAVCLLLPPLLSPRVTRGGPWIDLVLGSLFIGLGMLLIAVRWQDENLHFEYLAGWPWGWEVAALGTVLLLGVARALRAPRQRQECWLDLFLPAALAVLVVGLHWGLDSFKLHGRVENAAERVHLDRDRFAGILALGLPAVLCYTFVERSVRFGLGVGALILASVFATQVVSRPPILQKRTFFGVFEVREFDMEDGIPIGRTRELLHGTTIHGRQCLEPGRLADPISYYHPSGPIGQLFQAYNDDPKRPFGVIGLGTGTMACYALPGQDITFYDIDAAIRDMSFTANGAFTFVEEARRRGAHPHLILGDARIQLEAQHLRDDQKYRFLIVDAFSSDAIPIHLITREALQVYLDRMAPDGMICFHISNRYLRLAPVLANLAADLGLSARWEEDNYGCVPRKSPHYPNKFSTTWVALAREESHLARLRTADVPPELWGLAAWPNGGVALAAQAAMVQELTGEIGARTAWRRLDADDQPEWKEVGVWTDDYSNLFSVLRHDTAADD
jgi:hypothetical protein